MNKFFKKIHIIVKINLFKVAYNLKLKKIFCLLYRLYDKSVMQAEPLLFINIIDIGTLHHHQHQSMQIFLHSKCQIYVLCISMTQFFPSNIPPILTKVRNESQ